MPEDIIRRICIKFTSPTNRVNFVWYKGFFKPNEEFTDFQLLELAHGLIPVIKTDYSISRVEEIFFCYVHDSLNLEPEKCLVCQVIDKNSGVQEIPAQNQRYTAYISPATQDLNKLAQLPTEKRFNTTVVVRELCSITQKQ